jgi:transcriptional regulator GlxA family with amidase domain
MRVAIVIYPGFDELDAVAPYEVLRTAAVAGADLETLLVSRDRAARVAGAHGLIVEPQGTLEEDGSFDVVIVPGGGWNDRAAAGAYAEAQRGELPAALRRLHEAGATLASVCTGGMLVSAAGLSRGRPATTHHLAHEELREAGSEVIDARVVDHGDLLSAGGVTAGIDLALWLVERSWGTELAEAVARTIEHDRRGPVWTRERSRHD